MEKIGRYNLLRGLIPKGLTLCQHRFYMDTGSFKTGRTWGIEFKPCCRGRSFNAGW